MSDYDFGALNDKEFEQLAADLLSRQLQRKVERFKSGKDGGVDGRFFTEEHHEVIIQCKHWLRSGVPALIRELKKSEAQKVRKIKPSRYIFVTSLTLSRADKTAIKEIFTPYLKIESEVLGAEDINDLLKQYSEVERNHYKLWICSANVLQTIQNAAIVGRSRYRLSEIAEASKRYVLTKNHARAMRILQELHCVIITGAPGVGKTTLADQLAQKYVAKGYELCFLEGSVTEAENVYREESRQIFYFDDFLGRNFLSALELHQDSQITNFIKRVRRDPKKAFILTSRSNIYNKGQELSDLFDQNGIDRNRYELKVSSLESLEKAKILYNHIWFSDLEEPFIEQLYVDKRYREVISHSNFNPRLIAFICNMDRLSEVRPEGYWAYVQQTLSDPRDVWRTVFEIQIDDLCRHIVIALVLHGRAMQEGDLKALYSRILEFDPPLSKRQTFTTTLRQLSGALLNRNILTPRRVEVDLFDPSIADYVIKNYTDDHSYVSTLVSCLRTSHSLDNIRALAASREVDPALVGYCLSSQLIHESGKLNCYQLDRFRLKLLSEATRLPSQIDSAGWAYVKGLVPKALVSDGELVGKELFEMVRRALRQGLILAEDPSLESALDRWVTEYDLNDDEFEVLSDIVSEAGQERSCISQKLFCKFIEYLQDNVTSDIIESDEFPDLVTLGDYVEGEVIHYVETRFEKAGLEYSLSDVEKVKRYIDVEEICNANMQALMHFDLSSNGDDAQANSSDSSVDAIDDLFDRT